MNSAKIIVFADKTVLKITGMKVRGLDTAALEKAVSDKLGSPARLIGVTGDSLSLDVYGLSPEQILANENGIVQAVSAAEGISAADVMKIASAEKAIAVDIDQIPAAGAGCRGERWRNRTDRNPTK